MTVSRLVVWAVAIITWLGGLWIIRELGGRTAVTGGLLLLVVALAALGIAVAGHSYGPAAEGPLDLSTRLGVGVLGGALGGLAAVAALWVLGVLRIPALLGVAIGGHIEAARWLVGAWNGTIWGLLLGVAYPLVPGRGPMTRGVAFSLVPALWTLLRVLPSRGLGVFGVHLGSLSFLVVLFVNLVWGLVAGGCLLWAESSDLAPVDRLPGEA
jgi:hypothetical protein